MNNETLGYQEKSSDGNCEYLTLAFSPLSAPLRSRWRNNGLSADFLGDYVTTFLPSGGALKNDTRQNEVRHAVAYIANELLENAMKYHERMVDIPITIHMELSSEYITVSASNGVGADQAQNYRAFVERILNEDAGELLVRQLEKSSEEQDEQASQQSCLGLLTIINDYSAQLGWQFEKAATHSSTMTVSTRAVLALNNLPGVAA